MKIHRITLIATAVGVAAYALVLFTWPTLGANVAKPMVEEAKRDGLYMKYREPRGAASLQSWCSSPWPREIVVPVVYSQYGKGGISSPSRA